MEGGAWGGVGDGGGQRGRGPGKRQKGGGRGRGGRVLGREDGIRIILHNGVSCHLYFLGYRIVAPFRAPLGWLWAAWVCSSHCRVALCVFSLALVSLVCFVFS